MRTIVFATQKGGSGKTTLAVHLAVSFEQAGVGTSIVDLDPQRSAWNWSQARGKDKFPDAYRPRLDQLAKFMGDLERNDVELVVVDTPPHSDERALAGLRLADLILVPFRASALDLEALENTARLIAQAGKTDAAVLVLNAAPTRSPLANEALEAAGEFGVAVAPVIVCDRAAYVHAITASQGVTEFEPKGKAAEEITALRRFVAKQLKIRKGTV